MNTWKPITESDFTKLFEEQYSELSDQQKEMFSRYRVPFWRASIFRSEQYGEEHVYVVARHEDGVLYFDDIEYGFNISQVDETGRILQQGGSQMTLKEAIDEWFPK